MDLKAVITANHHGRFLFRICEYRGGEKASLGEECLNKHILRMSDGEQAPGESYWYTSANDPAREYTMRYKLPNDLTCDGVQSKCVMQWRWEAMNSCILQDPSPPQAYLPVSNMGKCGAGNVGAETFWNCASIAIKEGSTGEVPQTSGTTRPPSPTKPPTRPSKKPGKKKGKKPGKKGEKKPSTTTVSTASPPESTRAEAFCGEPGRASGFHADPESSGFFRCESTGSFFFSCPSGTRFREETQTCDWA